MNRNKVLALISLVC